MRGFFGVLHPRFIAVPQCACSDECFWCVTFHIFFSWNQQMSRWMSLHGVFMFLSGLLGSGMSFSGECYYLCVLFCQF